MTRRDIGETWSRRLLLQLPVPSRAQPGHRQDRPACAHGRERRRVEHTGRGSHRYGDRTVEFAATIFVAIIGAGTTTAGMTTAGTATIAGTATSGGIPD